MSPQRSVALVLTVLALTAGAAQPVTARPLAPQAAKFRNCAALNQKYPHGVGLRGARDKVSRSARPVTNFTRNTDVYRANTHLDRDNDKIACEKR